MRLQTALPLALLMALTAAACSSDDSTNPGPKGSGGTGDGGWASTASTTSTGGAGGTTTGGSTSTGSCGDVLEPCCGGASCGSGLVCEAGVCKQKPVGEIGKNCSKNSDCQSGICLPLGNGKNACTKGCASQGDCLAGWDCKALIGQSTDVCQCNPSAESCNGKDDDCNGIVDDEPAVTEGCKSQEGPAYVCQGGSCACASNCGGSCVDTKTDAANCGACGNACAAPMSACSAGACVCPGGGSVCGGACVDKQSDAANCGACGNACAQGASCQAGSCVCSNGGSVCGGKCVDKQSDAANCGACGNACALPTEGGSCVSGFCTSEWAGWPMPNPASAGLPNPSSYDTSTPGVVVDKVTGLMWQRDVPASGYKWADAKTYCAGLSLAGHQDWRLPTSIELVSLVDFTVRNPAIDTTAFPNTPSDYFFWSSSPVVGDSYSAWSVDFDYGYSYGSGVYGSSRVRCVR